MSTLISKAIAARANRPRTESGLYEAARADFNRIQIAYFKTALWAVLEIAEVDETKFEISASPSAPYATNGISIEIDGLRISSVPTMAGYIDLTTLDVAAICEEFNREKRHRVSCLDDLACVLTRFDEFAALVSGGVN